MPIIKLKKSIIPSCDVDSLEKLEKLVKATCSVKGVGAYKIGFELVIPFGMEKVVNTIRKHTKLPIIYDHQKAGTDIPEMGGKFMKACKLADAVIIFPQAGPETEAAWIKAAQENKINIIVGGEMTHPAYLKSEDGFIEDGAPSRMYEIAASMGVTDFVIPGNKPEKALEYVDLIKKKIKSYRSKAQEIPKEFLGTENLRFSRASGELKTEKSKAFLVQKIPNEFSRNKKFLSNPVFYSPGLVAQGGNVTDLAKKLDSWHAIIGRAIYEAKDMKKAAEELVKNL